MLRTTFGISAASFGLLLSLSTFAACGDGGSASGDGDTDDSDDTGDGDGDGDGDCEHPVEDGAADGEACTDNMDCASRLCVQYQDAPPDSMATCAPAPDGCRTRVTGTVRNFESGEIVPDVMVRVLGAVGAASNPKGAKNLALGTTGGDGRFDATTDERADQPLGLAAGVEGPGFFLTATGLAEPEEGNFYGPGTNIHDVWAMPTSILTDWSAMLEGDEAFAESIPLGELGGVIGLARDKDTGEPVGGIVVASQEPDTTLSVIRYLDEDKTGFNENETASHGLFVIVEPKLGEKFDAVEGGMVVDGAAGTVGSAKGAIFTLVLDV